MILHDKPTADRNARFNAAIEGLAGEIFQTESEHPFYISPSAFAPDAAGMPHYGKHIELVKAEIPQREHTGHARWDVSGLGAYERVIFSCLAWGGFPTYVLAGEMGSGKSTTIRHLVSILRRPKIASCEAKCGTCSPIIVHIDFNEGFTSHRPKQLLGSLRRRLLEHVCAELRRLFRHMLSTDAFVAFIESSQKEAAHFASFDAFAREVASQEAWQTLTKSQKANALINYVDHGSDIEQRLERAFKLLAFVRLRHKKEQACTVLICDNLDRVVPEAQLDLLLEILAWQKVALVRTLVPLRRTTFERLQSQAAYSFGLINHNGARPLDVISERIKYYLTNWKTDRLTSGVSDEIGKFARDRLSYALDHIGRGGRTAESLRSIAGGSCRIGLFMMERVLCNAAIPYDENPSNADEVIRAVLVGSNSEKRLLFNDQVVANIFTDGQTPRFSLLCVRILQLMEALKDVPGRRQVANIVAVLKASGGWRSEEVIGGINYLLNVRRPLLWVDGRTEYRGTASASARDIVYATESGYNYHRHLIMSLSYVFEAFMGLDWDDVRVPSSVDIRDMRARFRTLRACLGVAVERDRAEFGRLKEAHGDKLFGTVPLVLVSSRMVYGLARSVLLILRSNEELRQQSLEELREWHSFVTSVYNGERETLKENERLGKVISEYEAAIGA